MEIERGIVPPELRFMESIDDSALEHVQSDQTTLSLTRNMKIGLGVAMFIAACIYYKYQIDKKKQRLSQVDKETEQKVAK